MAPDVQFFGRTQILGLPISAYVVAVIALILLGGHQLIWGRWIYAVGGNPAAAVRSGICAAVAAVIVAGRANSGSGLLGNRGVVQGQGGAVVSTAAGRVNAKAVLVCGNAYLGNVVPELTARVM
ncbi:MAG: hypothetical protein ABIQ45_16075, partial [Devosia sp.]